MSTSFGSLFVVSAPSGAGKTSLVRALMAQDSGLSLSISHTTRSMRDKEIDGDHYHFVDRPRFESMIADDAFLEYATVFGNYYGTSRAEVDGRLAKGMDVLLEIDWQGARQVRERAPGCIGIFVLPPSVMQLEARLKARAQDAPETIERRMQVAQNEMSHYEEFDYIIVNDDFNQALAQMQAVIHARRLVREKQAMRHSDLIRDLLAGRTDA